MIAALAGLCWALAQDTLPTDEGNLVLTPVEHATLVLSWGGKTVFVDPTKGADAFRGFGKPDLILVTDIHGDHFDPKTLQAVRTPQTVVIVPGAVADKMGQDRGSAKVLANGEKTACGPIGIEAVPMYNLTPERKNFHTKGRGNGYVLSIGGKRLYISGDTEDIPEMRALKNIDAALVCMNLPFPKVLSPMTGALGSCIVDGALVDRRKVPRSAAPAVSSGV